MTFLTILGRRARASALLFVAALALTVPALNSPAYAMRVSPMVVEMESRGTDATARIEVQNINPGNLAFETRVFRMAINAEGEITETPADEDFLIFPPQGVLPAGGRQVVRLQWVGEPELATSKAFYVSVEQLPVPLEPSVSNAAEAQVQILYNMRALVVVAPPGAEPNVSASSVHQANYLLPVPEGSDAPPQMVDGVEITLRNEGRRHAMMANFGWR